MNLPELLTKKLYLYGYGISNQEIEKYFKKNFPEKKLILITDKYVDNYKGEQLTLEEAEKSKIEVIFKSPGIKQNVPLLAKAELVINDIELTYLIKNEKKYQTKFIAITGSNGKTTTVSFLEYYLQKEGYSAYAVGNIGVSPLKIIDLNVDYLIFELSSFQILNLVEFKADYGVLLNFAPDHLDYHETIENYAQAKIKLTEHINKKENILIDKSFRNYLLNNKNEILQTEEKNLAYLELLQLDGQLNKKNYLAVFVLNEKLNLTLTSLKKALVNFPGVEDRMEIVPTTDKKKWINDTKATNSDATISAIESLNANSKLTIIVGGSSKGEDFTKLKKKLQNVKQIYAIGQTAEEFSDLENCQNVETLENAVKIAAQMTEKSDIILLAPACASFDQFANYHARGNAFKDLVRKETNK